MLLMGEAEGGRLARILTSGLEGDTTVEQNRCLGRVARGEVPLAEFLERFGHRAAGEMELSEPRWREAPRQVEGMVARLRARGVGVERQDAAEKRSAAVAELPDALARRGGSSFREEVEEDLRLAQTLLPYREKGKHYLMMGYELVRMALVELARRWELGQDIFFLHLGELGRFEAERDALAARIPLLVHACGLICERGGVLSHGAIIARDLGIPAVVFPRAAELLRDGQRVRVDGNCGTVSIPGSGAGRWA
jgi:hypothetical protein